MLLQKKSLALATILIIISTSVLGSYYNYKPQEIDQKHTLTDYSDISNWFKNPNGNLDKNVDVFFIYPTIYYGNEYSCTVTNEEMRANAPLVYDKQTSVYEESCNIYMPFYRQVNAFKILECSFDKQHEMINAIPAKDCIAAFEYYLEHYNNGKPFILAGHSQGSSVLLSVMEYLKNKPEVIKRMVASYVIGYSVTQSYLDKNPHLKFAKGATDTGVIISWNTEAPILASPNILIEPGNIAINPIIWTTEETYAGAELSLGSRIMGEDKKHHKRKNYADAKVSKERGSIICTTVDAKNYSSPLFSDGTMHGGDYELYYYDLQNNIKIRIESYFSKQ